MQVQIIRGSYGQLLGRVETDSKGNKITRNESGVILNRYDASRNVTRSLDGTIIATGDITASLRKR